MSDSKSALHASMKLLPLSQASAAAASPSSKQPQHSSLAESINCSLQRVHSIVAKVRPALSPIEIV